MAGQPLESAVVRRIRGVLREAGAWEFKTHGSGLQQRGIPDLIVCYRGVFVALEVKRPGETATPLQTETIARIERAGGIAAVVSTIEEVHSVLKRADVRVQGDRGA